MNRKLIHLLVIVLTSVTFHSCQKDSGSTPVVTTPPSTPEAPAAPSPTPTPPSSPTPAPMPAPGPAPLIEDDVEVFATPNSAGHVDFIRLVQSAQKSINLMMFILTNSDDADALIAASRRNIKVRVILDRTMLNGPFNYYLIQKLTSAGVEVKPSSDGFSISHGKSMTIDDVKAMISTINLTKTADTHRGFGVVTQESSVVKEFDSVFESDWLNSDRGMTTTPPLSSDLLWSPNTSLNKLVYFIASAKKSIDLYVENFASEDIAQALISAAQRGVVVRVITPMCDANPDPYFNWPMMKSLNANGIQARLMPAPASLTTPYIHAKALMIDSQRSYVGSVNFTVNSLSRAREVGIIFSNAETTQSLKSYFAKDWNQAQPPPGITTGSCP